MTIERFAAFSDGLSGGNPAGVVIGDELPSVAAMQATAAEIGYSESVFAAPAAGGWRVRYFAPQIEVPFCGHATIALAAALALRCGDGSFALELNESRISVTARAAGPVVAAALQSPPTTSAPAPPQLLADALALFGYTPATLDARIPPAIAQAGARHLVLALATREQLAAMRYDLTAGRDLMLANGLVTISLIFAQTPRLFHARNPFAAGGVYEDPATGAAAAALGGYLRDLGWPHGGAVEVIQGEDMGTKCRLDVAIGGSHGSSITVSGTVRRL